MMLAVEELTHRYGDETAVADVSFGVEAGELLGVLGPSGCGKTTVVQAIAGHVEPTAGRVLLRGEEVTGTPPEGRRVGVVFQRSTLFPHMTVGENVAYGLVDATDEERDRRVEEYLELVDLGASRDARPDELSGGQRRRVELARALAPEPDVLLLDEPLSALDRALRGQLREEIGRIQRETGVTTLFVTHDQDDAMALADRLVVLSEGRIAAIGPPGQLYAAPPSPFVASFLGRSNELPLTGVELDNLQTAPRGAAEGSSRTYHVRPEDVALDAGGTIAYDIRLQGVVERVADLGTHRDVVVALDAGADIVVEHRGEPPAVGDRVMIGLYGEDVMVFAGEKRLHLAPESAESD